MLDGLDISEVNYLKVLEDKNKRLESKFYTSITGIQSNFALGEDIVDFVQYGTSKELNDEKYGFPILRLNEFESNFIGVPSKYCNIINNNTFENLKLIKDDVLVCRTNGNPKYVGKSAIVMQNTNLAYASYLFKIRPKKEFINSSTLSIFLNSKYGRQEIEKYSMVSNQANFSPAKFREIRIPLFINNFQLKIENLVKSSYLKQEESKILYKQSEDLLLKELDLLDFKPSKEKIAIKTFSKSFGDSGRLDSEYYQVKYDEIIDKIKSYNGGHKLIREVLIDNIKSGTTPKTITKEYIPNSNYFLRAESFNNDLTLNYNSLYSVDDKTFIKHNSIAVKQFDILVSMTGTIGNVAIVTKNINAIINQNIVKLSVNQELLNYNIFALFMKTVGKDLLIREQTGNVQPYVNIPNFSNLVIPIIDDTIQTQIEEKIKESFKLKEKSKQLLEVAKKAVEIAIEENEEIATEFIGESYE